MDVVSISGRDMLADTLNGNAYMNLKHSSLWGNEATTSLWNACKLPKKRAAYVNPTLSEHIKWYTKFRNSSTSNTSVFQVYSNYEMNM